VMVLGLAVEESTKDAPLPSQRQNNLSEESME
jgi:hypothetical protein